jgi:hypothetical protein
MGCDRDESKRLSELLLLELSNEHANLAGTSAMVAGKQVGHMMVQSPSLWLWWLASKWGT